MKEFSAGIVIKFNDHTGLHGLVTDTDLIADWQMEYVFRSHLTYALEKANEFYLEKREQVLASFNSCAHAVDAIAQVTCNFIQSLEDTGFTIACRFTTNGKSASFLQEVAMVLVM